ncbi:MAG: zf-HC2 domain-containing protein [Sporichthyaceae bacterium]|nr:zf-HC2 domain-containing protein [Sporichthyaceae bacterium]
MAGTKDMASCMQVARQLHAYLDGEIDDVTARRIARHLEVCRRCGLEASTYTEIKSALVRRGEPVPDEALERLRRFGEDLVDQPRDESGDETG